MIELNQLERSYKTGDPETWVLRRVRLSIRKEEFLTIMGPSGAGKSSLLNVLAMLDGLTVAENIYLPLSYKDIPKSERQALVADTLERFNIVGKKNLYPSQLSGGQQQLVGIARAVIHRRSLLLSDEPTGNLQSSQAKEIMELFRQLNEEGATIVKVTHSEVNAQYGTRTIELRDGWVSSDSAEAAVRKQEVQP